MGITATIREKLRGLRGKSSRTADAPQAAAPTASLRQLREQVESRRLRVEQTRLDRQLSLMESVTDSIYGTPIPFEQLHGYRGQPLMPIFMRDIYQHKSTTLRVLQDVDRARNLARYAYETNGNAQAVINGLAAYVVGSGYEVSVTAKNDPGTEENESADPGRQKEADQAQRILDEFIEANDLAEAEDGCPLYDEIFMRSHRDGEVFLRLFPDEWETTKCRVVEPDNIRPPAGSNWEGPWAGGMLSASGDSPYGIAWDTQSAVAYNINYPLVNREEQVAGHFIKHLKLNVAKNVKRGISSLYAVDEDLRGTQKLKYAAREGAKIRASIPYIRQHELADKASIQALQQELSTGVVPRTDGYGSQYDVQVQQIEPGQVHDIPQGMEYKDPPHDVNGDEVERALRVGLQTLAARFNAPYWLASGESNDSSYASSLTSESPFLRTVLRQQRVQTGFWQGVFKAVLEIAIEQGRLGEGALERLHVVVSAQSPQTRNRKEEADTNKLLHDEGVISIQTWTAESGHDYDEEQSRRKEETEAGIGLPKMPMIGAGGHEVEPQTVGGMRQREEGAAEQYSYAEAFASGFATASVSLREMVDDSGHEHRGKGPGGGQFAPKGEGGSGSRDSSDDESGTASESDGEDEDEAKAKRPAVRVGDTVAAKREGKGKDAKVLLEDGTEAPSHITPAMIPPAWEEVRIYTDPKSEVYVEARDKKGRKKTVYAKSYEEEMQAAKFYRVRELLKESTQLHEQNQKARENSETREEADCLWLMEVQATRPGSEADTKGVSKLYGMKMTGDNIVVTSAKGKGRPKVELSINGENVLIRDSATADELIRRKESGGDLEDSTYWLKSHGATTLEARHVVETKEGVRLQFVGKEGVWHDHLIKDESLAKMIVSRKNSAGDRGGKLFGTSDGKLSAYVKTLDHGRFSPKDFRTKRANELAISEIVKKGSASPSSDEERMEWIKEVAVAASNVLGNRPSQCIESYIDPSVWSVWPKTKAAA